MGQVFRPPVTLALAWPSAQLRALTGQDELALADTRGTRPERVDRILSLAYDRIADQAPTPALLSRLSSGTRAWLLARAAASWRAESGWFQAPCPECGAVFDFPLRLGALPRGEAGPGFPVARVETSLGPRRFEVPNGGHEAALAQGHPDPVRALLSLAGLSARAEAEALAYTPADLLAIEAALEETAPEVADHFPCACPECGQVVDVAVDPLTFALPRMSALLAEVHLLARAYHWSEAAILDLPSTRRRAYAALIAREGKTR